METQWNTTIIYRNRVGATVAFSGRGCNGYGVDLDGLDGGEGLLDGCGLSIVGADGTTVVGEQGENRGGSKGEHL